jgi:hypothetical protein
MSWQGFFNEYVEPSFSTESAELESLCADNSLTDNVFNFVNGTADLLETKIRCDHPGGSEIIPKAKKLKFKVAKSRFSLKRCASLCMEIFTPFMGNHSRYLSLRWLGALYSLYSRNLTNSQELSDALF